MPTRHSLALTVTLVLAAAAAPLDAAKLTVELGDWQGVTAVGALKRWDTDGNPTRPVDPKARIDAPHVDYSAAAEANTGRWVFDNLPPGKYDLLIMAEGRVRIEGFTYPPVLEFDPFLPGDATVDEEVRTFITGDIRKSPHYENKVVPLAMGGNDKTVRVLVMLIRDKPTSYKPGLGTIRHEIWQYTYRYGGWLKEKRTRVLEQILLPVDELRKWTWLWDAKLGDIEVGSRDVTISYARPALSPPEKLPGLRPY